MNNDEFPVWCFNNANIYWILGCSRPGGKGFASLPSFCSTLLTERLGFAHGMVRLCLLNGSVQFSHSVVSDSLRPHESQHARPPCSSPIPGVHPNSCASSRWCHPVISSSVIPFSSCPQSLPASKSFPMSQLFTWGGQSPPPHVQAPHWLRRPRACPLPLPPSNLSFLFLHFLKQSNILLLEKLSA